MSTNEMLEIVLKTDNNQFSPKTFTSYKLKAGASNARSPSIINCEYSL